MDYVVVYVEVEFVDGYEYVVVGVWVVWYDGDF